MTGPGRLRAAGVVRLALGVAAAGALVGAATVVRIPGIDIAGARADTSSAATTLPIDVSSLACPGPETIGVEGTAAVGTAPAPAQVSAATPAHPLRGGRDGSLPTAADSQGTAGGSAETGGGTLSARLLPGEDLFTTTDDFTRTDDAQGASAATETTDAAAGVRVRGTGTLAPGLVADQLTLVRGGDLRGLSSTPCRPGADEAWLVGGGTDAGRRGRIVLVNPGANPVDVDVEVLGASGAVSRSAGSSVGVPARSRVVLLLGALAPGVAGPVVHVTAAGGAVTATLHDSLLAGTTARGVDDVQPAAPPSRHVIVPGVVVQGAASLRLASPSSSEAVAQVRLIGPDGPVEVPGGGVVRVPAGSTHDVDLSDVPAGAYAVEVTSDVPVVAGAQVQRAGRRMADLAWLASAPAAAASPSAASLSAASPSAVALSATSPSATSPSAAGQGRVLLGTSGVPSGAGWASSLLLTAPRDAVTADIVSVQQDGTSATRAVTVAAGTTARVKLSSASAVWVRPRPGGGDLVAARMTTKADSEGELLTGGPLRAPALVVRRPAVVPGR